MKNIVKLTSLLICMLLVGCVSNSPETTKNTIKETTKIENTTSQAEITPYMVMLKDNLYTDTGETNSMPRCGTLDFNLKYTGSLNKIPSKSEQANFKSSGGQYSWRENRIEVLIDDQWHIFAYNENNLDGVSIKVLSNTNTSVTLEITNNSDSDIQYGEEFSLEIKDSENGEWFTLFPTLDDYTFNDIAYTTEKNKSSIKQIDFEWLYGKLEVGTYRVVKKISPFSDTNNKKFENYWYSAEFTVSK